jgi:hypothetical protein
LKAFSNLLVSKNHHALVIGNPFDTLGANVYGGSTKSRIASHQLGFARWKAGNLLEAKTCR